MHNKTYCALYCRLVNQAAVLDRFNNVMQIFGLTCLCHIPHRQPYVLHVWQRTWTRPDIARSVFTDENQRGSLSPAFLLNCVPRFDFLTQNWRFFLDLLLKLAVEGHLSFARKIWTPISVTSIIFYLKRHCRCLTAESSVKINDTVTL